PRQDCRNRYPGELVPVEEREPEELGIVLRVQRRIQQPEERQQEQQVPPARVLGVLQPLGQITVSHALLPPRSGETGIAVPGGCETPTRGARAPPPWPRRRSAR